MRRFSKRTLIALAGGALLLALPVSGLWLVSGHSIWPLATSPTPTFNRDITPLVYSQCAICHRDGQSAPFPLLTYRDVQKRAEQIATVTQRRYMPPWLPESDHGQFANERRLTDEQIDTIARWVEQGCAEGDPSDLPPRPQWVDGWQLGMPDLVVQMEEPYTLPADGSDVFRNFVIPVPIEAGHWVKAVEFRFENPRVVHHAVLTVDRTRSSRRLDLTDPEPGFGGMLSENSTSPDGHFIGWTPGNVPSIDEEFAWRLDPGTDLVLLLHLLPSGKPEAVQASIGLHLTDQPPSQTPIVIRLGSKTIDIPAGEREYTIDDEFVLPVDVEVLGVYPHAHYLGRSFRSFAILPGGDRQTLLDVPQWDFNWQDEYRYRDPILLPRGTRLTMEWTYDNSIDNVGNPHQPPQRVVYGPRSTDEMGDLWIQLLTRKPQDLAVLKREFAHKECYADVAGYEQTLARDPNDAEAHASLAVRYKQLGRIQESLDHFQRSLRIDPEAPSVYNNFGNALQTQGRLSAATLCYRKAIAIDPSYAVAHNNLGIALASKGEIDEAMVHFRKAIELMPDYAGARVNLAQVLQSRGLVDEAIEHYRQALRIRPDYVKAERRLQQLIEHPSHEQTP